MRRIGIFGVAWGTVILMAFTSAVLTSPMMVRVIDETGEDYLYHKSYFVFVNFPPAVKKKILALQNVA